MYTQHFPTTKTAGLQLKSLVRDPGVIISVLLPLFIGVALFFVGIGIEMHEQISILQNDGIRGLDIYLKSIEKHLSLIEYITHSLSWSLRSYGGNHQGIGMAVMLFLTPLCTLLAMARFAIGRSSTRQRRS